MTTSASPRPRLLRSACELFETNGYAAVSIRDIVASIDLPKGTFYNYFRSKEELASVLVLQQRDSLMAGLSDTSAEEPLDVLSDHFASIQVVGARDGQSPLMLLSTLAAESSALPVKLREHVCTSLTAWLKYVAALLDHAQRRGDISADESPELVAAVLVNERLGAMILQRCQPRSEHSASSRDSAWARLLRR